MKRQILVIISLFFFLSAFSQKMRIQGEVVEKPTGKPLEAVSVTLLNKDSAVVSSTTTNKNGFFFIENISTGDYSVIANYLGYTPSRTILTGLNQSLDLGKIMMEQSSINLTEVQVTGKHVIQKIDRQIILPTPYQVKASGNGIELLNNLMLPRIDVNLLNRTISLSGEGNVQIRINGVRAKEYELSSIRPKDVLRVEYHQQPGQKFGNENIGAVIDFILKRKNDGGVLFLDAANAPFTSFGNNLITTKYNFSKSEIGLTYSFNYRDYQHRRHEISESFVYPDYTLKRDIMGDDSPFRNRSHNLSLSYHLQEQGKYVFNALLRGNYENSPYDNWNDRMTVSNPVPTELNTQTNIQFRQFMPSLDLYYQRILPNKQALTFNVVGTSIDSEFSRNYTSWNQLDTITSIKNNMNGKKYSLITEGIYERAIKKIKLNAGIKWITGFAENKYTGTTTSISDMNSSDLYAFTEIQGNYKKLGYLLGIGVSRSWFKETEKGYNYYTFRPTAHLSYSINPNAYFLYTFSASPVIPSLAALSDVAIKEDAIQTKEGNPNLTPYRSYSNALNFSYLKGIVKGNVYLGFTYYNNPIMEQIYLLDNQFIFTQQNQKQFTRSTGEIECSVGPFLKKILTVQLRGGINYFDSKGQNYSHQYTNPYYQVRLMAQYKQWGLMFQLRNRQTRMWGETITYGENMQLLALKFSKKHYSIEAGAYYPFSSTYKIGSERISSLAPSESWLYTKENTKLLILRFTYNLDYGRKYKIAKKKLNNFDTDDGIVK